MNECIPFPGRFGNNPANTHSSTIILSADELNYDLMLTFAWVQNIVATVELSNASEQGIMLCLENVDLIVVKQVDI